MVTANLTQVLISESNSRTYHPISSWDHSDWRLGVDPHDRKQKPFAPIKDSVARSTTIIDPDLQALEAFIERGHQLQSWRAVAKDGLFYWDLTSMPVDAHL